MRFAFVRDHASDWPVRVTCRVLGVSPAGYYAWRGRPPAARGRRRDELAAHVRAVHAEVRGRYGSPRVHAELAARGVRCCVNTVAAVMRRLDLRFDPARPNEVWTADITYVPTAEGWLYLAAVEDLYSRAIVGWAMADTADARLVVDALDMAVSVPPAAGAGPPGPLGSTRAASTSGRWPPEGSSAA